MKFVAGPPKNEMPPDPIARLSRTEQYEGNAHSVSLADLHLCDAPPDSEAWLAAAIQFLPLILSILVDVTPLLQRRNAPALGVSLLALVEHHPAVDHATKRKAQQQLASLKAQMAADTFAGAAQEGRTWDLETAVAALQSELAASPQPIPDPTPKTYRSTVPRSADASYPHAIQYDKGGIAMLHFETVRKRPAKKEVEEDAFRALAGNLRGRMVLRGDDGYDAARGGYLFSGSPTWPRSRSSCARSTSSALCSIARARGGGETAAGEEERTAACRKP